MLAVLGGSGAGLVWGWLLAAIGAPARRRLRTAAVLAVATLAAAAVVLWLGGGQALAAFLGAAALTLWLHLAWRERLYRRYRAAAVRREATHA